MTVSAPSVDNEEIEQFTRMADEWWDENGKFKPLHRMNPVRIGYIRDQIVSHFGDKNSAKPLEGLSLLDIGCGGGLLCEPMTRLGAKVTGIDAGEKNIQVAALHAQNANLSIDYRHTSAEALHESGAQYDVVLAMEIVEHVADVEAFLGAVTGLVKPGGLLFMSTLNRTLKSYAMAIVGAEYVMRWLPRGTHDWNKFLRPSDLCNKLRHTGMSIHHMTGMVYSPFGKEWSLNDRDLDVNYLLSAKKA